MSAYRLIYIYNGRKERIMYMTDDKSIVGKHGYKRWIYVFLGIIIMMFLGTVYSYSIFRVPIEDLYKVGSTLSGLPYMISLASYAVFMFLAGKILNKYKPKYIILIGGIVLAVGWLISSIASNIFILTLTYGLIIGAGVGIIYGVPMHVVAMWFPDSKGFTVGLVLLGFGLSPLLTAPIVRVLVENFGVMNTFKYLGIFFGIFITIISFMFMYPSKIVSSDISSIKSKSTISKELKPKDMINSKSFKGLYLNFTIATMIGLMLIGLTNVIGIKMVGISAAESALYMSVFAVFNGLGRPTFGWLTDKYKAKKIMTLSFLLIILAAVNMIFFGAKNNIMYGVSFSIFWFNLGGWLAIAPTSTINFYGIKHYTENYGIVFTGYGVGAVLGVLSSGILVDILGSYDYVFYYVILLALLGFILSLKLIKD